MIRTNRRHGAEARILLARKIDNRIRKHLGRSRREEAIVGRLLYRLEKHGLCVALDAQNLTAYAKKVADWDATKTSRIVTLVRHLRTLPKMRAKFFAGEIPWTKACV